MASIVKWGPHETVTNSTVGWWSSRPQSRVWTNTVNRGFNSKSVPVDSDHHSPTSYAREVVETTADRPFIARVHGTYPDGRYWDYTHTRYISAMRSDPAFWAYPTGYSGRMDNARSKAITKARERLRQRDTFQLGLALFEAKKTAEMLADTGGLMAKGIINFNRALGLRSGAGRLTAAAAGAWLQGYYGWGSLARDGFDLYSKLQSQLEKALLIKSSYTAKIVHLTEEEGDIRREARWEGLVKCGYTAKIIEPYSRMMDSWGLMNPLSIAWELVPLSFVVDWMVPIGNTLDALTATAGLDFESGYISTVSTARHWSYLSRGWVDGEEADVIDPGYLEGRIKRFDRETLSGFLLPQLYANENPFSTNRTLSGLALILQAVTGRSTLRPRDWKSIRF